MRRLLCIGMLALAAGSAQAQSLPDRTAGGLQMTRPQLEELLRHTEQLATAGSERSRQQAQAQAAMLRQRLAEGDLAVGDRVALYVPGYPQLSDTFTVAMGRVLNLPEVGEVPVAGVLRSELPGHMTTHIGRYIREPTVRAQPLIRLEVRGAIGRPGFYTLASDMLLSELVMVAGGPGINSNLDRMRIIRGTDVIWSGPELRSAIVEGLTLDQLNVRGGDRVDIPTRQSRTDVVRNVFGILSGVATLVYLLSRVR